MKTIQAQSACIEIIEHDRTVLLRYTNKNDYAGMAFSIIPRPIFELRFEALFFHERVTEEQESESITTGETVKVSSAAKTQRLLQVEPIPKEIMETLKLALNCNYVEIDGGRFVKEENMDNRIMNNLFELQTAEVWLTFMSEGYFNNVYGII
ncbi:MAG: hypothetical protein KatS3mg031_2939 [Chitinophagales bacterium]|nr:MAG: hypothetical protein KatS3mg031_2939 [Chitinophagales bacterium]